MSYVCADITVLSGCEAIKKRPTMYVGPLDSPTLGARLILGGVNALLEHDDVTSISIVIINDTTARIIADGPGWSIEKKHSNMKPWPVELMTSLHAGRGDVKNTECQLVVTNALCECAQLTINKENKIHNYLFNHGKFKECVSTELIIPQNTGTVLFLMLDTGFLGDVKIDVDHLKEAAKKLEQSYECKIEIVGE